VFDTEKLKWMNNVYMKKADTQRVADLAIPHLQRAGLLATELDKDTRNWAVELVGLYQEQLNYAAEIVPLSALFFTNIIKLDEEASAILAEAHVPAVLNSFRRKVEESSVYSPESIGLMLKAVQAETGFKGKQLYMSIRVALTGQMHGRD